MQHSVPYFNSKENFIANIKAKKSIFRMVSLFLTVIIVRNQMVAQAGPVWLVSSRSTIFLFHCVGPF